MNRYIIASAVLFFLAFSPGTPVEAVDEGTTEQTVYVKPTREQLREALKFGRQYVKNLERLEKDLADKQEKEAFASGGTSPAVHGKYGGRHGGLKPHNAAASKESRKAAIEEQARLYLSKKLGIPPSEIDLEIVKNEEDPASVAVDRQQLICSSTAFRSSDGTCNNLANPLFGKSGTILQHLYSQNGIYADGVSSFRKSVLNGNDLPAPRIISSTVLVNDSIYTPEATLLMMQMGQFLDHDLSLTPARTLATYAGTESPIECCVGTLVGSQPLSPPHPECATISIPSTDPVYKGAATCINFVRSTFGFNLNGTTPPTRQHININTHWLDASQVYGSTPFVADWLRDKASGKGFLKTSIINGRPMLPLNNTCTGAGQASSCFAAGDERVLDMPMLTVMHTLWVREHNRVAAKLATVQPGQSDEFYYQQARRIVIAEWQHIVYTEWLPVLIGPDNAAAALSATVPKGNNPNPAIFSEFSTAAFRMGHSMLKSFLWLYNADGTKSNQSYFLSDAFFRPDRLLEPTFLDNAVRALLKTPVQTVDNSITEEVTSKLFKTQTNSKVFGADLVAINIQRGRDHGLPAYATALAAAIGANPNFFPISFDHLASFTPPEAIASLKSVYQDVRDIDLFIGGVSELPLNGALLGPTFADIFTNQFTQLKTTDRFFYTDLTKPVSFTAAQLAEIQKVSFSRILCDNTDGTVLSIQPSAFKAPIGANAPVACFNIRGIDFSKMVFPVTV